MAGVGGCVNSAWPLIAGNTYGHYEEHGKIIRRWLDRS